MATKQEKYLMKPHIIVTGNPVDGFFFYGPYPDFYEAQKAAEKEKENQEYWWIAPIEKEFES